VKPYLSLEVDRLSHLDDATGDQRANLRELTESFFLRIRDRSGRVDFPLMLAEPFGARARRLQLAR
jgi:hypothetical protein